VNTINFKTKDWFDVVSQLQQPGGDSVLNGKEYVFLYICANWSVACKKMEETLTDKQVSEFFNANFLNMKIYLGNVPETADITHKLSETLDVSMETLPHFLFINHKGKVVHQAAGDLSPQDLLTEAKAALSFKFNWV
jgi:thioredoxin-related protein